jgi:GTP cyclohydrolase II
MEPDNVDPRVAVAPFATSSIPIRDGRNVSIAVYRDEQGQDDAVVLEHRPDPEAGAPPLVRVHSACLTGDTFRSLRCDCGPQLDRSLAAISDAPWGILVYLPLHEGRGIGLANKIRAYALQDAGLDTAAANVALGFEVDERSFSRAAQILASLGAREVRLLSNNPAKVSALQAHGIRVVERLGLVTTPNQHNTEYLRTKERLGHLLDSRPGR